MVQCNWWQTPLGPFHLLLKNDKLDAICLRQSVRPLRFCMILVYSRKMNQVLNFQARNVCKLIYHLMYGRLFPKKGLIYCSSTVLVILRKNVWNAKLKAKNLPIKLRQWKIWKNNWNLEIYKKSYKIILIRSAYMYKYFRNTYVFFYNIQTQKHKKATHITKQFSGHPLVTEISRLLTCGV